MTNEELKQVILDKFEEENSQIFDNLTDIKSFKENFYISDLMKELSTEFRIKRKRILREKNISCINQFPIFSKLLEEIDLNGARFDNFDLLKKAFFVAYDASFLAEINESHTLSKDDFIEKRKYSFAYEILKTEDNKTRSVFLKEFRRDSSEKEDSLYTLKINDNCSLISAKGRNNYSGVLGYLYESEELNILVIYQEQTNIYLIRKDSVDKIAFSSRMLNKRFNRGDLVEKKMDDFGYESILLKKLSQPKNYTGIYCSDSDKFFKVKLVDKINNKKQTQLLSEVYDEHNNTVSKQYLIKLNKITFILDFSIYSFEDGRDVSNNSDIHKLKQRYHMITENRATDRIKRNIETFNFFADSIENKQKIQRMNDTFFVDSFEEVENIIQNICEEYELMHGV
jgi:hypothetical protein